MDKNLKLFGMQILLPVNQHQSSPETSAGDGDGGDKRRPTDEEQETDFRSKKRCSSSESELDPKTPSVDDQKNPKPKLKKPDKILPCPRCKSSDTKFCYYNNYNINQPRHFCRCCQRYWTAGGTMRNVPVGAGRRKSKTSSSNFQQITVSEPFKLHQNRTLLSFGSQSFQNRASVTDQSKGNIFRPPVIPVPPPHLLPWNIPMIPVPVILHPGVPWATTQTPTTGNNNTVLLPKTLRIDDPEEAAKSTIWTTLGISQDSMNRKSLFQAFQPKGSHEKTISPALKANPSALTRSNLFHEST